MTLLVVDSSLLIAYLRGDPAVKMFLEREFDRGEVVVPALVAWELWRGAHTPKERANVDLLLSALEVDPMSHAIARLAADLDRAHRSTGTPRPQWDLLIAAHAIHHDCPLASHDGDHEGIEGLETLVIPGS